MKTTLRPFLQAFAFCILAASFIGGCSSTPPTKTESVVQVAELSAKEIVLNKIAEDYFEEILKLDPLYATSIGDHRFDDRLEIPLTQEHRERSEFLVRRTLGALRALNCDALGEQVFLTCQALTDDLEAESQVIKTDLSYLMPVNQFDSFFADFPDLAAGSSYVTFENKKDFENFLKRMHRVPAYLDAMIENMNQGIAENITTPQVLVKKALKQMDALLPKKIEESVFYKPLVKLDTVVREDEDRDELRWRYEAAIKNEIYPAYQKLRRFVKQVYLPKARKTHGLKQLEGGDAYYLALARVNTTTTLSPDEIMSLGLSEVTRIREEMEAVKTLLGFAGSLSEFYKSIRRDPTLYPFHTAREVMDQYEKIHQQILTKIPEQFKLLPKAPFEIREVEKFKAENASEAYQNASPDGARPGIFWVPVPDATRYSSRDMESLFLHEAIPGHHFQISIQQELQNLPRYRRFAGNNAYVEGWALYTEGLGKELGMYTNPFQWVGRLSGEMHRAIRLVVDTGLHAKGWTREKAIQYSLENEAGDEASVTSEIERYMAIPGQALSYKIGELKILKLKKQAKEKLGERFDVREFHSQILKDGALPLSTLERKLDRWITQEAAKLPLPPTKTQSTF
ncbi:MAG: DUF885 domain-containing protein [Bdellovibrionales bacterium]|nr:DUF885 domain-containing protein [Oligoflexia bacterium]